MPNCTEVIERVKAEINAALARHINNAPSEVLKDKVLARPAIPSPVTPVTE